MYIVHYCKNNKTHHTWPYFAAAINCWTWASSRSIRASKGATAAATAASVVTSAGAPSSCCTPAKRGEHGCVNGPQQRKRAQKRYPAPPLHSIRTGYSSAPPPLCSPCSPRARLTAARLAASMASFSCWSAAVSDNCGVASIGDVGSVEDSFAGPLPAGCSYALTSVAAGLVLSAGPSPVASRRKCSSSLERESECGTI